MQDEAPAADHWFGWHVWQIPWPSAENLPAGQATHWLFWSVWPGLHTSRHCEPSVEPGLEVQPGLQGVQALAPCCVQVFAGHVWQVPLPSGEKVPAGQDWQVLPERYWPALQVIGSGLVQPSGQRKPWGQGLQADWPGVSWNQPCSQRFAIDWPG